jgi:hypothetical protein
VRKRLNVVVTVVAIVAATVVASTGPAGATRAAASGYPSIVNAAIADLQAYWTKEFPQLYGGTYKPVAR